eukprot:comp21674_c0_seq1/m.48099 comp21674_c0_seq1/g.48099  ORF comp21674_c0_seq1/g.48099 comp21674_c0_seq1/m.48099 type:complete len:474 (+) comp21674_c0_seq1:134-1555(+)
MTARFSSSCAILEIAAQTLACTSSSSLESRPIKIESAPTNERPTSATFFGSSMHGPIAPAALACTLGLGDLSSDHSRRRPSWSQMMRMLTGSSPEAHSAPVTLMSTWWLVLVSSFTSACKPLALRMATRFDGILAQFHSAPATLIWMLSVDVSKSCTSRGITSSWLNTRALSLLAASFHTAPVTFSSALGSVPWSRRASTSRPLYSCTRRRTPSSSPSWYSAAAAWVDVARLFDERWCTSRRIAPGGFTVLSVSRISRLLRGSAASSSSTPATGITSSGLLESSRRTSGGMPPALRTAVLLLAFLVHAQSASAAERGTSFASLTSVRVRAPLSSPTRARIPPFLRMMLRLRALRARFASVSAAMHLAWSLLSLSMSTSGGMPPSCAIAIWICVLSATSLSRAAAPRRRRKDVALFSEFDEESKLIRGSRPPTSLTASWFLMSVRSKSRSATSAMMVARWVPVLRNLTSLLIWV